MATSKTFNEDAADFMKIGFFQNLGFMLFAVALVISVMIGLLLLGIVYVTSGIRLDPVKLSLLDEELPPFK